LAASPDSQPVLPPPPKPQGAAPRVESVLLDVIAEKTGYPAEMLQLDMTLDADLGIDSIKRVEILSALQDRLPNAPAVKPEQLGTLHTLRDIASFLGGQTARPPSPPAPAPSPAPAPPRPAAETVALERSIV